MVRSCLLITLIKCRKCQKSLSESSLNIFVIVLSVSLSLSLSLALPLSLSLSMSLSASLSLSLSLALHCRFHCQCQSQCQCHCPRHCHCHCHCYGQSHCHCHCRCRCLCQCQSSREPLKSKARPVSIFIKKTSIFLRIFASHSPRWRVEPEDIFAFLASARGGPANAKNHQSRVWRTLYFAQRSAIFGAKRTKFWLRHEGGQLAFLWHFLENCLI